MNRPRVLAVAIVLLLCAVAASWRTASRWEQQRGPAERTALQGRAASVCDQRLPTGLRFASSLTVVRVAAGRPRSAGSCCSSLRPRW